MILTAVMLCNPSQPPQPPSKTSWSGMRSGRLLALAVSHGSRRAGACWEAQSALRAAAKHTPRQTADPHATAAVAVPTVHRVCCGEARPRQAVWRASGHQGGWLSWQLVGRRWAELCPSQMQNAAVITSSSYTTANRNQSSSQRIYACCCHSLKFVLMAWPL